jgi:hypothetical protein
VDPLAQKQLAECNARMESYEKNFPALQQFVRDEILAHFSEFDLYCPACTHTHIHAYTHTRTHTRTHAHTRAHTRAPRGENSYTVSEPAALGAAMLVPARYVGEAVAPCFYFFVDGLVSEKI